ncbi:MAG: HlyD family efflux transporter periplasmic adaptor subunit [Planctomycetes bacterium]|nr:HlyD family efflux transporter periplasmic adaptor subunit [Planctomycetota bacterium]
MTPDRDSPSSRTGEDTAPPATAANPYAEILNLARRASSRHGFLAQALAYVGRYFGCPYAALYARCGSETIQEETHNGPTDPKFWAPAVQEFLTSSLGDQQPRARLLSGKRADLKIALLSTPLSNDSASISGAVALIVRGDATTARTQLATLQALASVMASALPTGRNAPNERPTAPLDAGGQALAKAAAVSSPEELAFALTNNLRTRLGCEQVALGLVSGRHVRILSISGLDDVNRRSPGVTRLRAAMEECLDFGEPIVCQQDSGWAGERLSTGHRLHQAWQESAGGASVVSIPLQVDDRCEAILGLRRRADAPFHRAQLAEIGKLIEPFLPAMFLVRQAKRGLLRHAHDSLGSALRALLGPGRLGVKISTVAVVAAATWFCWGTLDYTVTASARIVPAQQRHIAVPFDGILATAEVMVGDPVRKGDVLCRFDQRELELERARLMAQLAVLDQEYMRAQAADNPVEARLVQANQRYTRVQLDLINRRSEQAICRAPFDGVVIAGDLRKQVGSVLAQGTPLFDVTPYEGWALELTVPEATAADVRAGQRGRFAGHARPEATQTFALTRMWPSAEVRDARNVYVVEAAFDSIGDWLRPGMEGVAEIQIGRRRVWWIALHRALDYLRVNFWL